MVSLIGLSSTPKLNSWNLSLRRILIRNILLMGVRIFVDKKFQKSVPRSEQKQKFNISLPFMGQYSNEVKKKFSSMCSKFLPNTKVNIIWNTSQKLCNLFTFNDRLPMQLHSKILYCFSCNGCNSIYIGKTKRHFLVRAYKHLGLSLRTGKRFTYNTKYINNSGILEHLHHSGNCNGDINSFEITGGTRNAFFLCIEESLLYRSLSLTLTQRVKVSCCKSFKIST